MKPRLLLLGFFALAATALAAAPRLTIGPVKLCLASDPAGAPEQERVYLPRSETTDHWSRRATVQVLKDLRDPVAYLKQAAAAVLKTGKFAHYEAVRDPATKEIILDYMTFPADTDPEQFAEWSLLRARYVAGRGLVVCRYSLRCYEVGAAAAVKVKAERSRMTGPFKAATFEEEEIP